MKAYEIIRSRITQAKKTRTQFSKALRLNEDDYMKVFLDKAKKVTEELNGHNDGQGSSAVYNLNMHQDFIINKLGLKKKLKGHDLIIKILLFKILGLRVDEEEMRMNADKMKKKPQSAMTTGFRVTHTKSSHSENRSSLHSYVKGYGDNDKPSTHQGHRFSNKYFKKQFLEGRARKQRGSIKSINQNEKHISSMDIAGSRKANRDLTTEDQTKRDIREANSPRSTINSIIDQCYLFGEDGPVTFDHDYSNVDSMFELSQQLAKEHNPMFKTLGQTFGTQDLNKKSNMRPSTIATKKKVTF
jgi:hypothetical protein